MVDVISPSWHDLEVVVGDATDELVICTPFYSAQGLDRVLNALRGEPKLSFWTRFSVNDWINGVADPPALLIFMSLVADRRIDVSVRVSHDLHAKAYCADNRIALLGSANLTNSGFSRGLEIMTRLRGMEAAAARQTLEGSIGSRLQPVSLSVLTRAVDSASDFVTEVQKAPLPTTDIDALQFEWDNEVFADPDVSSSPTYGDSDADQLEAFLTWLERHVDLAGAEMILRRATNLDRQNLTGHVRQSFWASMRFVTGHPGTTPALVEQFARLGSDQIPDVPEAVLPVWLDQMASGDAGFGYDPMILRSYLPPSLGGTRIGGGGGSSTLKRVLPLVAAYRTGFGS